MSLKAYVAVAAGRDGPKRVPIAAFGSGYSKAAGVTCPT